MEAVSIAHAQPMFSFLQPEELSSVDALAKPSLSVPLMVPEFFFVVWNTRRHLDTEMPEESTFEGCEEIYL